MAFFWAAVVTSISFLPLYTHLPWVIVPFLLFAAFLASGGKSFPLVFFRTALRDFRYATTTMDFYYLIPLVWVCGYRRSVMIILSLSLRFVRSTFAVAASIQHRPYNLTSKKSGQEARRVSWGCSFTTDVQIFTKKVYFLAHYMYEIIPKGPWVSLNVHPGVTLLDSQKLHGKRSCWRNLITLMHLFERGIYIFPSWCHSCS